MPSDLPGLPGVADLAYRTRGGQALIYDGVHARGPCVVKILSAEAASSDDELVERFAREVEVLGMMTEPAVVQLWGRGVYLGRPYAVLEAIEGRTFAEVIAAGPVAVDQALVWIDELLQVVAALHDREIHHRDIKPANLMLEDATESRPARVRVLDFGVVRFARSSVWSLTDTEQAVGTPRYFPPEIYRGEVDGVQLDLWACAVTLYELVTPASRVPQLRRGEVVQPDGAPPQVRPLLDQLLSLDQAHRPASARAMSEAIRTFSS